MKKPACLLALVCLLSLAACSSVQSKQTGADPTACPTVAMEGNGALGPVPAVAGRLYRPSDVENAVRRGAWWYHAAMDRLQAMQMFVRVVETGSFSRAAREFATTQPTVTKQVAAIEARLQVRLLNRNTRGVSPTEPGQQYYERCKAIVRDVEEAEGQVRVQQDQARGLLRVGSSVAFGRRVIIAAGARIHGPASAVATGPEFRGSVYRPGGARHRRGDQDGQAGRLVAGRAVSRRQSMALGRIARLPRVTWHALRCQPTWAGMTR